MKKFIIILLFLLFISTNVQAKPNPLFPWKFPEPVRIHDGIQFNFYFHERTVHKRHLLFEVLVSF